MLLPILLTVSVMLNMYMFTKIVMLLKFIRNALSLFHDIAHGKAKIDSDGNITIFDKHA